MRGARVKTNALDIWTFRNESATTFSLSLPLNSRGNFFSDGSANSLRNELLVALRLKKDGAIGHRSAGKEEEEHERRCEGRVRHVVTPKVAPGSNNEDHLDNNNNNNALEGDGKESESGTQNNIHASTAVPTSAQGRPISMTRTASDASGNNLRANDDSSTRMTQTREEEVVGKAADLLLRQSLLYSALRVNEDRESNNNNTNDDNNNNNNNNNRWPLVPSSRTSSSSRFGFYRPRDGEPSCFVNCSALANQPTPTTNYDDDDDVINNETGGVGSNEEDGPQETRAQVHSDRSNIDTLDRSNIRPPHSLGARRSRRGLAFDCTRHELPVRDGDRIERAGRFLEELHDAGVCVRGMGQLAAVNGNGRDRRRIAAGQWTTVNPDDALGGGGGVGAADVTEDSTSIKMNQNLALAARANGIDVFTVTSTEKGDRHGANRYFHRNGLTYTKKLGKSLSSRSDEVALPFSSSVPLDEKWRHFTGGPSNQGASYALGSELELNRLRALQSRVLDDGDEDQMAITMYETTHGDIGGQNDEMRQARLRSMQQQQQNEPRHQMKIVTAAKRGDLWPDKPRNTKIDFEGRDHRYKRAVEETALMGDLIEVRDEAFKITALSIPNLRIEEMEKSAHLRSAKSQKELARAFHMGGM